MIDRLAVIHIGDTHAREDVRGDHLAALDAAIYEGARLGAQLAAFLWPGDLFHTLSDIASRNALQDRAVAMANLAPVFIVRGNHDARGDLDVFRRLRAAFPIYVIDVPMMFTCASPIAGVDLAVFGLPYPDAAGLVAAGTPADAIAPMARAALDAIILDAGAQLAASIDLAPTIPIFAAHANIAGAVSSVGQPQIGGDLDVDAATLSRLPADVYVAFNHIHKHQTVGRAVYAGSLCRLDFGELEPKGVVVAWWNLDADTLRPRFDRWEFAPIAVPAMFQIEGELTPTGFTYRIVKGADVAAAPRPVDTWRDAATSGDVSFKGADVRVRYTYKRGDAAVLNVARIHAEFAEARTLKIEAVPIAENELRAPEIVAAPTLLDKLELYAGRQGVEWSTSLAGKAARLEVDAVDTWRDEALAHVNRIGADILGEP